MNNQELIKWILAGDPAIAYKCRTELLHESGSAVQALQESLPQVPGYIRTYLEAKDPQTGMWGGGIYTPKWTSTHYTLLELKNMKCPGTEPRYKDGVKLLVDVMWHKDGYYKKGRRYLDLCVAGMIGSMLCHGGLTDERIHEIMDYILAHIQPDGGFNCFWQRSQKTSINTTFLILQFFLDYEVNGYTYRLDEAQAAALRAEEWMLEHQLYKRISTGEPMHKMMVQMPYPARYKYNFLVGLEYMVDRGREYDPRMESALKLLESKRLKSGAWPSQGNHPGPVHVKIIDEGRENRMNTLRALKVLSYYNELKKNLEG